ncbi:MAG TPA: hypothetical protein VMK65_07695 [Longimicrobiales bacterium]|nr:hypothetical protein [Longimicrobiales bacterium]
MSRRPVPARIIRVIRMGPVSVRVLHWLERPLADLFHAQVRMGGPAQDRISALFEPPPPAPVEAGDAGEQGGLLAAPPAPEPPPIPDAMRADEALDVLVTAGTPGEWHLGVASFDLLAAPGEPVFGRATVDGCCTVVSTRRLDPVLLGRPPNPERFRRRLVAEAVHELGHVAGLGHCRDIGCVMFPSETLEDTDRKGTAPCFRCAAILHVRLGRP